MDDNTTPKNPTSSTDDITPPAPQATQTTPVEPTPTPTPDPVTEEPASPIPETPEAPEETRTSPTPSTSPVVVNHSSKKHTLKTILLTLLVLLLAAGAAGAAYVWQQSKVDNLNAQLTTVNAKANQTTTPSTATSTDPDLTKATKLVKDFYDTYSQNEKPGYDANKILSQYGNQNLAFYYKYYNYGFNPVLCSQEELTDYTVSGSKSEDGVATVLVKAPPLGDITVRVVDQGGLKVDGITCPGDLGAEEPHDPGN